MAPERYRRAKKELKAKLAALCFTDGNDVSLGCFLSPSSNVFGYATVIPEALRRLKRHRGVLHGGGSASSTAFLAVRSSRDKSVPRILETLRNVKQRCWLFSISISTRGYYGSLW